MTNKDTVPCTYLLSNKEQVLESIKKCTEQEVEELAALMVNELSLSMDIPKSLAKNIGISVLNELRK